MDGVIYHHERCGKSRGALCLLRERGVEPRVVDYVATPPTVPELRELARLLGTGPLGMMRTDDKPFAELGLTTSDARSDDEWFALIARHPILLQRPIVVIGGRAVIARPSDLVLGLLG